MFRRNKKKSSIISSRVIKDLRDLVPDYIDYEKTSNRIQTDRAIRKVLLDKILKVISQYSQVQNKLIQGQILSTWSLGNTITKQLQKMRELLTGDNYRHSTFFDNPHVSEYLDLKVFYTIEHEMLLQMDDISAKIEKVTGELNNLNLETVEKDVKEIKNIINDIFRYLSDRTELIACFEIMGA